MKIMLFVTTVEDFTIIIFLNDPNGGGLPTGDLLTAESALEL
jgi:hypothetical protein